MTWDVLGNLILGGSLKGGGVALAGLLIAWQWKRAAAADRHTLWLLVLVSFLVLPLLQLWGPPLALLPSWRPTEIAEMKAPPIESTGVGTQFSQPLVTESAQVLVAPLVKETSSLATPVAPIPHHLPWWAWLWLAGFLVMSGKAILGRAILWSLGRSPENGKIQAITSQLRTQLGINRSVEVVLSTRRRMPMTWGWRHPKILLPEEAWGWEEERLHAVLFHELAHVKRYDALTQCLLQVVTAIYWFHPLAWLATWRLIGERERACDQVVVDGGIKPSAYARQLMAVALTDAQTMLLPSAGMSMARQGELEQRVRTLLESNSSQGRIKQRWIVAIVCGWAAMVCPLAFLSAQEPANNELKAAPPTLEADLLAAEDTTDRSWDAPEATDWHLKVRLIESFDSEIAPPLQVTLTIDDGADDYQFRGLRLLVNGAAYQRKGGGWPDGTLPPSRAQGYFFRIPNGTWISTSVTNPKDLEWQIGIYSVQLVYLIATDEGKTVKLSSNVIEVRIPADINPHKLSPDADHLAIEAALSAKRAEALREPYLEEFEKLQHLKIIYGSRHPKLIEQQRLVDAMKAMMPISPIGDRQQLMERYDKESEKLNELRTKYLHKHPKIIKQKALIAEIEGQLGNAQEVVRVASAVSGIVSGTHAIRNQQVQKGFVLLTLDQRRARLTLESAAVQVELAKGKLETISQSVKAGKSLLVKLREAESNLQLAETARAVAEIDLEDLTIRAPADGVVLEMLAKVGEYVSPEKPVVHFRPTKR